MMNGNGRICMDCQYMGFTCVGGRVFFSCYRPDFSDLSPCLDRVSEWLDETENCPSDC